ncbi:MAG TPA: hypothetical protein VMX94_07150 [Armatimonadota bacterium]|nr:hypothetical protein [Armatimonadota bacterium]
MLTLTGMLAVGLAALLGAVVEGGSAEPASGDTPATGTAGDTEGGGGEPAGAGGAASSQRPASSFAKATEDGAGGQQPPEGEGKPPEGEKAEPSTGELKRSLAAVARERDAEKRLRKETESELQRTRGEERETRGAVSGAAEGQVDAGTLYPELKGLAYDPKEKEVELDGEWMSPRAAKAILTTEQLQQRAQDSERAREEALIDERRGEILGSIRADMKSSAKKLFPNASERILAVAAREIEETVAGALYDQGIVGRFDPYDLPEKLEDIVSAATQKGMNSALELVHELQNPQAMAQAAAGEREPAAPGGKAASPGSEQIRMADLTPEKRLEKRRGIVDRVFSKLGISD